MQYIVAELKCWLWEPLLMGKQVSFKVAQMSTGFGNSNEYVLMALVDRDAFVAEDGVIIRAQEE